MKKINLSSKAVGVIVFGLFILFIWLGLSRSSSSPAPVQPVQQSYALPGDNGVLQWKDQKIFYIATTKDSYDALQKVLGAGDQIGFAQLKSSGQVLEVPANTKVLVISSSWGADEIRFLNGKYAGQTGWVEYEMINKI